MLNTPYIRRKAGIASLSVICSVESIAHDQLQAACSPTQYIKAAPSPAHADMILFLSTGLLSGPGEGKQPGWEAGSQRTGSDSATSTLGWAPPPLWASGSHFLHEGESK